MARFTLAHLDRCDPDAFVEALGGVFEDAPWVAAACAHARPFASVDALHAAMSRAVREAGEARQTELIRAHPDLAGKAARAGAVTAASSREQAGAGLDRLSDDEFERFHRLNDAYRERFSFPFVLAVRGHDARSILAAFEARLRNDPAEERARALDEIDAIARGRLDELVAG